VTTDAIADARFLGEVEPVYETFPGWKSDTTVAAEYSDLPENARSYLKFIEEFLGHPKIKLISVGQEREKTIRVNAI
jgi:adenylosuccinate synthase